MQVKIFSSIINYDCDDSDLIESELEERINKLQKSVEEYFDENAEYVLRDIDISIGHPIYQHNKDDSAVSKVVYPIIATAKYDDISDISVPHNAYISIIKKIEEYTSKFHTSPDYVNIDEEVASSLVQLGRDELGSAFNAVKRDGIQAFDSFYKSNDGLKIWGTRVRLFPGGHKYQFQLSIYCE